MSCSLALTGKENEECGPALAQVAGSRKQQDFEHGIDSIHACPAVSFQQSSLVMETYHDQRAPQAAHSDQFSFYPTVSTVIISGTTATHA